MRRAAFIGFLMVGGCPALKDVPRPPSYEECIPSHRYYHNLAEIVEDTADPGEIPSDPETALQKVREDLAARGISIVPKAEGIEDWSKFTTTFPDTILIDKDFEEKPVAKKAEVLWHERVHVRQYGRLGLEKFLLIYSFAEGRWAIEVQAYRESFRVRRAFGEDEVSITEDFQLQAEALYDNYALGAMPRTCAINGAISVWELDSVP